MKQIHQTSFVAFVTVAVLALSAAPVWAHGGEDHSQDQASATSAIASGNPPMASNAAQRLPDGTLFVPKAMQRQWGLRTVQAEVKALAASVRRTFWISASI